MKPILIALALVTAAWSTAPAQRVSDARLAYTAQRESQGSHRALLSAERLLTGGLVGTLTGGALAWFAFSMAPDNSKANATADALAAAAVTVYVVGTAYGASWIESTRCDFPRRFRRALVGSLVGAAAAIGTASALEGQNNRPAVVAGVVGFLATPVGAVVSLWRCD